ncbi:queuosine precursor transporter [Pseudodesulfovibrio sediminis]|uniref:Probable queuosine precursor transporter n=1 Tax=Pseudodesulfovibrio sediminis TaxID=2810563 RepID=A0ABN6ET53_9BACT|nr:queuosine precursor transporter [Pseudodesulfovibrio sediminis]BCS88269.1 transporter [Pseudodesulfovibrio sediminis]
MENLERKAYALLISLFIGGLVVAALISSKIITIFGLTVPAGVLAYSLTFVVSDVISEVWGKELANEAVTCGFVTLIFITALAWLAVYWPAASFWQNQDAFAGVVGNTPRIVVASLLAYIVSQKHDIWLFHLLKRRMNGRFLWLRNNLSTMVSQLIDSSIFVTVAFYGVFPVGEVIFGQWLVKLLIAALDTPIVYILVAALRERVQPVAA